MWHFFKYFIGTLFIFAAFNFFRSNGEMALPLKFNVPLLGEWLTPGIPVFYLIIVSFCSGILCAALVGAFRIEKVREEKRELKVLKKEALNTEETYNTQSGNLPPLL